MYYGRAVSSRAVRQAALAVARCAARALSGDVGPYITSPTTTGVTSLMTTAQSHGTRQSDECLFVRHLSAATSNVARAARGCVATGPGVGPAAQCAADGRTMDVAHRVSV